MDNGSRFKKYKNQAEMLGNRVKKRWRHLKKRYAKQQLTIFRLYDWDIPEIRAVVDWYDGHLVVAEYSRRQSTPDWLPMMGDAVVRALDIPTSNLHLKIRRSGLKEGKRYERLNRHNQKIPMKERDLTFLINLTDFVDTGLFSDHRNTRQMIRKMAKEKSFLNLYCYTGAFTCYAASGGACKSVSVDRSETAVLWAGENMAVNRLDGLNHKFIQQDVPLFLKQADQSFSDFDLAVVDPPSYSSTRVSGEHFNIAADHPGLLNAVFKRMKSGGTVFFSTNHQDFNLMTGKLFASDIKEITDKTIPEDYRHRQKKIHRCWEIKV